MKLIMMKKILTALAVCCSISLFAHPQTNGCKEATYAKLEANYPPAMGGNELRGDLKNFITTTDLKSSVKVSITSDEVYVKFMNSLKYLVIRMTIKYNKKDRMGTYTEYIAYVKLESKQDVIKFIKSL